MQKITNVEDLRAVIQELESKQAEEWPSLKEQILKNYESLKPINLLKNTLRQVVSAPDLKTDVINTAIGFSTGFIAKKVLIGNTDNPLRKLLGTIFEIGIANAVAKNAEGIKSVGEVIFKKISDQFVNSEKA